MVREQRAAASEGMQLRADLGEEIEWRSCSLNQWERKSGEIVLKLAGMVLFVLLAWRKKMRWKKCGSH